MAVGSSVGIAVGSSVGVGMGVAVGGGGEVGVGVTNASVGAGGSEETKVAAGSGEAPVSLLNTRPKGAHPAKTMASMQVNLIQARPLRGRRILILDLLWRRGILEQPYVLIISLFWAFGKPLALRFVNIARPSRLATLVGSVDGGKI
jgi:hypothetical protein